MTQIVVNDNIFCSRPIAAPASGAVSDVTVQKLATQAFQANISLSSLPGLAIGTPLRSCTST